MPVRSIWNQKKNLMPAWAEKGQTQNQNSQLCHHVVRALLLSYRGLRLHHGDGQETQFDGLLI